MVTGLVSKGPRPGLSPHWEVGKVELLGKDSCNIMKITHLLVLGQLEFEATSAVGCGNEQVTSYHLNFLICKMDVMILNSFSPSPFLI